MYNKILMAPNVKIKIALSVDKGLILINILIKDHWAFVSEEVKIYDLRYGFGVE